MSRGYWDKEKGWIGKPLKWIHRNIWCKIGFHKWGTPWCIECGEPDKILQKCIQEVFEKELKK